MYRTDNPEKEQSLYTMPTAAGLKKALFLLAVLFFLFSAFVTTYHFHPDLQSRPDCAICKFSEDLSSGDKHQPLLPIPLEILVAFLVITQISNVPTIFTYSLNNRAPPV